MNSNTWSLRKNGQVKVDRIGEDYMDLVLTIIEKILNTNGVKGWWCWGNFDDDYDNSYVEWHTHP